MRPIALLMPLLVGVPSNDFLTPVFHLAPVWGGVLCCSGLLLIPVIALAIYDWRKARRPAPPPEDD